MTAYTARVGATWLKNTQYITSPNASEIPAPVCDHRDVCPRMDGRLGEDDFTQWPQIYHAYYAHLAAIPRRPQPEDPMAIMWWNPTRQDFVPNTRAILRGPGTLSRDKLQKLRPIVSFLMEKVDEYEKITEPERRPPILRPLVKSMTHALSRLDNIGMSYCDMLCGVTNLQRLFLEVQALIDYMTVYKPKMDRRLGSPPPVANTVGAFTTDARVAQDFVDAGLPVWLIRPASVVDLRTIDRTVSIKQPELYLQLGVFDPPFSPIFTGNVASVEKLHAIHEYS